MRKLLLLWMLLAINAYAANTKIPIQVTSPLGGETYFEGATAILAAKTTGKTVAISISRDGGTTFTQIGVMNNRAKDRTVRNKFFWNVTGPASDDCIFQFNWSTGKKHSWVYRTKSVKIWTKASLTGPPGADGAAGPQGLTGPQGLKGDKGDTGAAGPQGTQGDIGPIGPQGLQGDTGPAGPQGPQGIQGLAGPQGPQGDQGDIGSTGPQGPQGPQGFAGPTGPQGPQGNPGPQGQQGDQGIVGPIGPPGPQGPQGDKGDTGDQGAQGPQGTQGPQGNPGPTGPQGPQGNQGDVGPTGLQGPVGPQGPQGPQGSQGPIGPNGSPTVSYINTASTSGVNFTPTGPHSAKLVINDANIRGVNNVKGRSQIFLQFSTTASNTAGIVSVSYAGLIDGQITVFISTQNYSLAANDSIDYQIINSQ